MLRITQPKDTTIYYTTEIRSSRDYEAASLAPYMHVRYDTFQKVSSTEL